MARRGRGEGSIYKRKEGRWAAAISLEGGKRSYLYGKTRAEVATKLRGAQQARANGLPFADGRMTLGEFLHTWLFDIASTRVRPRTWQGYEQIVRLHLTPALGQVRLAKLSPPHVERMMKDGLAAGRSPRAVAHDRAVLRAALNATMKWGLVGRNVAMLTDPPRVPEAEPHALSRADAQRILTAVEGDRLEALFTVALAVGLRQSEALGPRWSDIDLRTGRLSVGRALQRYDRDFHLDEPKTKRSRRTVALPGPVVQSLREHRARQLEERLRAGPAWVGERWGDLVFSNETGAPLHGTTVARRFKQLIAEAGLPPMRYQHLRHGAASLMAAQGVPPRVAMEVLGHSQISTTMNIYSHVAPESQQVAADRVAEALWGAS